MRSWSRADEIDEGIDSVEERRAEIERLARKLRNHSSRIRARAVERLIELGNDGIWVLREALYLEDADVQVLAANGLGQLRSRPAVDALVETLPARNAALRAAAVKALGDIGEPRAEPALRPLLADPDLTTRTEAAVALGKLGLEQSIPALMDAYRQCFLGQSARKQRWIGVLVACALLVLLALFIWGTAAARAGGAIGCVNIFMQFPRIYLQNRRAQSKVACAITEALVAIAERNPRPELHRLIPELRAVAVDRIQHEPSTRDASRLAADRIEALTAALHDMPIAAGAPSLSAAETLPRPAESPRVQRLHREDE